MYLRNFITCRDDHSKCSSMDSSPWKKKNTENDKNKYNKLKIRKSASMTYKREKNKAFFFFYFDEK